MDQVGVGVWPACTNSYFWTVDVGYTLRGPQAITTNPIYEGAHMFNATSDGQIYINFIVSGQKPYCGLHRTNI